MNSPKMSITKKAENELRLCERDISFQTVWLISIGNESLYINGQAVTTVSVNASDPIEAYEIASKMADNPEDLWSMQPILTPRHETATQKIRLGPDFYIHRQHGSIEIDIEP